MTHRIKLADRCLPDYTDGEEIMNMVTHIIGGALGIVTLALCVIMTYICTWALYVVQTEDEIMDFAGMMKYVDKNINFMVSYVVCGVILWGTIGFVLSKVIIKLIKLIINYK